MPEPIDDGNVPVGLDFLELIREQENRCEQITLEAVPTMGLRAPQCLEGLGTFLSLLDRATSCWWGCPQGDHLLHRLIGRGTNQTRAGIRLMSMGFYDEALGAARAVGEIANLTWLFLSSEDALADWRTAPRGARLKSFGPRAVRDALRSRGLGPPVEDARYRFLSEVAAHVTPATLPQAHNASKLSIAPGSFQEVGVLLCLNEIARAVALLAPPVVRFLGLPEDKRDEVVTAGRGLLESVGGVAIEQLEELYEELEERALEAAHPSP